MAMRLDAGKVSRSEVFAIDPKKILVDESLNGRAEPHAQEGVRSLAESILRDGQLQPVVCRRVQGQKVQLVLGYRRYRAVALINDDPKSFPPDLRPKQTPLLLRCVVQDMNDEEAFVRNVEENRERSETTALDDAHNQRELKERYGWDDARIARQYGVTPAYVCRLRKILQLPKEIQRAIPRGLVSAATAMDLADLSRETQRTLYQRIRDEANALDAAVDEWRRAEGEAAVSAPDTPTLVNGEVNDPTPKEEAAAAMPAPAKKSRVSAKAKEVVVKKVRAKAARGIAREVVKKARAEKIQTGKGGKPLSVVEIREFYEGLTGPAETSGLKSFAEDTLEFLAGKKSAESYEKWLRAALS